MYDPRGKKWKITWHDYAVILPRIESGGFLSRSTTASPCHSPDHHLASVPSAVSFHPSPSVFDPVLPPDQLEHNQSSTRGRRLSDAVKPKTTIEPAQKFDRGCESEPEPGLECRVRVKSNIWIEIAAVVGGLYGGDMAGKYRERGE